jgi:hypothetical protein
MFIIYFSSNGFISRSDTEIAYAKSLRKTSDTLQKLAGRAKG